MEVYILLQQNSTESTIKTFWLKQSYDLDQSLFKFQVLQILSDEVRCHLFMVFFVIPHTPQQEY